MPKSPKWNELPCPDCKEPAAVDALRCPHCQRAFTPGQVEARKQQQRGMIGFGCATLAVLAGALWWCSASNGSADIPDQPGPTAKADAIAAFRQVLDIVGPCDRAGTKLTDVSAKGDLVGTVRAARNVEDQCLTIRSQLEKVTIPVSMGKAAHAVMSEGLLACQNGSLARWSMARDIQSALDSGKPSEVADVAEGGEQVARNQIVCAAKLVQGPVMLGATTDELGLTKQ